MSDMGDPPRHNVCKVIVHTVPILSTSKHPPVIVKKPLPVKLTESDDIGLLVASISASDPDNDTLWYDIVGKCNFVST